MYFPEIRARIAAVTAAVLAVALASCAKPPPPPPAPPPAPVVPTRPYPPQGASPEFILPPVGPDGKRITVNTGLSEEQTTWNLRSAFNVAALNCLRPQHAQILAGYKAFLDNNERTLMKAYKSVEADFKEKYGKKNGLTQRDVYMTQVYNHFAFPPTMMAFCDGVLAMSIESLSVKSADLDEFAARKLPVLEQIFQDFYTNYARYKTELALWDANYGALYGPKPVVLDLSQAQGPTGQTVAGPRPAAGAQVGVTSPGLTPDQVRPTP